MKYKTKPIIILGFFADFTLFLGLFAVAKVYNQWPVPLVLILVSFLYLYLSVKMAIEDWKNS